MVPDPAFLMRQPTLNQTLSQRPEFANRHERIGVEGKGQLALYKAPVARPGLGEGGDNRTPAQSSGEEVNTEWRMTR